MKLNLKILSIIFVLLSCKEVDLTDELPVLQKDSTNLKIPDSIKLGPIIFYNKIFKETTYESARDSCKLLGKNWRLPTNDELLFINQFKNEFNKDFDKYNYWNETDLQSKKIFRSKNWSDFLIPGIAYFIAVRDNPDSISYRNSNEELKRKSMLNYIYHYEKAVIMNKFSNQKDKLKLDESGVFYIINDSGSSKKEPVLSADGLSILYASLLLKEFSMSEIINKPPNWDIDVNYIGYFINKLGPGGEITIIIPSNVYNYSDFNSENKFYDLSTLNCYQISRK
jgi:hypothetical protein